MLLEVYNTNVLIIIIKSVNWSLPEVNLQGYIQLKNTSTSQKKYYPCIPSLQSQIIQQTLKCWSDKNKIRAYRRTAGRWQLSDGLTPNHSKYFYTSQFMYNACLDDVNLLLLPNIGVRRSCMLAWYGYMFINPI